MEVLRIPFLREELVPQSLTMIVLVLVVVVEMVEIEAIFVTDTDK